MENYEEVKKEIKTANRKALPRYLLLMLLGVVLGIGLSVFARGYDYDVLYFRIKRAGDVFKMDVAPWLSLAVAVVVPLVSAIVYKRAKKLLVTWDGKDVAPVVAAEKKISFLLWLSGSALILSCFLVCASYSGGLAVLRYSNNPVPLFASAVSFLSIYIERIVIRKKCVDALNIAKPGEKISVLDVHFAKKLLSSSGDAEKLMIGKCAYTALRASNTACLFLAVLCIFSTLYFDVGFLPSLLVCAIWLVNHTAYQIAALKCAKPGGKDSQE